MTGITKHITLASLLCLACFTGNAQTATDSATQRPVMMISLPATKPKLALVKPKKPKPIRKEMSFGIRLNTDGWGVFIDRGKVKTEDERHADMFHNVRLLTVEFDEKKNEKEVKSTTADQSSGGQSGSYIYGKTNNFYTLKLGYGYRRMIAGKPDPGCVSIHWVNSGGISIGLLKPYYIKAGTGGGVEEIKYTEETQNQFLDKANIAGKADFATGIGETKIIPGVHFHTGLHFDFANNKKLVLAAEAGINAELYSEAIELMATQKAEPYFVNAYVSFQFGKRW